jgi:peptide/nickel transport system substrate-binding protein
LPANLWKKVPIEDFSYDALNLAPMGSGPYQIKNTTKNNSNNNISYFDLAPFGKFALGKPYINRLRLRFYENDGDLISAYRRGEIDSLSAISPNLVKSLENDKTKVITAPLPRVFGVFFNPSQNKIFTYSEVRSALNQAVDKRAIINSVLFGFGIPLANPIPLATIGYPSDADTSTDLEQARLILENKGWSKDKDGIYEKTVGQEVSRLSFTLATSDAPELKAVAEQVSSAWKKFGAEVTVKVFEKGDLSQDVIRPRKYDAVLFGEVVGRNPDPYVFWHSSQRFDPGLNIANYANVAVDKMLENLRSITDPAERLDTYQKINAQISADSPAIFLYTPLFVYLVPVNVNHINLLPIANPADRFITIAEWYISIDKVWPIFAN